MLNNDYDATIDQNYKRPLRERKSVYPVFENKDGVMDDRDGVVGRVAGVGGSLLVDVLVLVFVLRRFCGRPRLSVKGEISQLFNRF